MIRPTAAADTRALARILMPVIRAGETYALDRDLTEAQALAYWLGSDRESFVAEADGEVLGTYYLRANQPGGGNHVANCGYMTRGDAGGRGIGRAMAEHSLARARAYGFRAMQFNFVVSINTRALALWASMDFDIVGRLPHAFRHPREGDVDALVLYRRL